MFLDIELEVRFLRKWLKEMEARIDPLQFSRISSWSSRDREVKMEEYQVLHTDIQSHGRIVKLVLGLCEDLAAHPGVYDVHHATKVTSVFICICNLYIIYIYVHIYMYLLYIIFYVYLCPCRFIGHIKWYGHR